MVATSIQRSPGSRVQGGRVKTTSGVSVAPAGSDRVGRHARSERMGRVDNGADALACEKRRQALGAAKAADALGNRRLRRIGRRPCERQDCRNIGLVSEPPRKRARFRRAAENEQAKAASVGGSMSRERWLGLVGIGEDGIDGLVPAAQRLIAQAEFVVGGKRHLALAGPLKAETMTWPSPIENALDAIEARRGRSVCVLASGDPFFFGVGAMLMRRFAADEMISIPAPSAFALAASRLGWSQQDCALLTLHGRPLEAIIPHLQPGARILALSWDDATPAKLAALLTARGMGRSRLTICEAMGGPSERIRTTEAQDFALDNVAALNTIALEVVAEHGARILPRAAGLPDEWFEHDGQITKREIRAMSLSSLAPRRGELLWDVGSGSGSVAIEWMLADPDEQRGRDRGPPRPRRAHCAQRSELRRARPFGCHRRGAAGLCRPAQA